MEAVTDGVLLMIVAVLLNHMGLMDALTRHETRNVIVNCAKCLTFWSVLGNSLFAAGLCVVYALSLASVLSYAALWVEAMLNVVSNKYDKLWESINRDR